MATLIAGLVLLLGTHSLRFFAEGWREACVARLGERGWKALYSVVSLAGLVLIVIGFGSARAHPVVVWNPPAWTMHVTALLAVLGFVLVAAAYVPGTKLKAVLGHPMVAGVKTWALGHLVGNGTLAGIVLFGALLLWSVYAFGTLRRRDRAAALVRPPGRVSRDAIAVVVGVVAALVFALLLHGPLIGLRPFG